MTPTEAAALFALLRAAYPDARAKVHSETADLWLQRLCRLERGLGETAVQSLIDGCRFWPSLAELNEQVVIAREQAAQERVEAERHDERRAFDALELPPLREVPEAMALLARFQIMPPGLERVDDGVCGDCQRVGERCRVGRVHVCVKCARGRLRAAARLTNEAA